MEPSAAVTTDVHREATVIRDGELTLFGWFHRATTLRARDCAAVICNPLGYEYVHSHRSLRHLADQLARSGVPALRFDYHGTGDSPGDDLDSDRLACWLGNIKAAIAQAQTLSGCTRICLIGVRMGATLAAQLASECKIDYLVLWNPCNSGRHYLREMKAIAASANNGQADTTLPNDASESAGFLTSAETAAQLQSINLLKLQFQVTQRALVIGRDDMAEDTTVADHLNSAGIPTDYLILPGYAGMMLEAQFTVVPSATIDKITDWLVSRSGPATVPAPAAPTAATALIFGHHANGSDTPINLTEQLCRFGTERQLFGLLSYREQPSNDKPVIVLLNAGAVHHVGPNRLYVNLARALSAAGFTCLRMDLEGLGDSVAQNAGVRENHPYPAGASDDVASALSYLNERLGESRFVLLGLCSGAHTAFHAGIEIDQFDIAEVTLINPLTFRWVEGMSLATTQHFQDVAYYKKSVRNLDSWIKLLRGKVDMFNLAKVGLSQLKVIACSNLQNLKETFLRRDSTPLSADLNRLLSKQRRISLFIAAQDPGYDLLIAGAKRTASKAIKTGKIQLQFIADADHTFTRYKARQDLIERVSTYLQQHWPRA
jgi:alpha-beta hydrolase superfamily lysophospholipase